MKFTAPPLVLSVFLFCAASPAVAEETTFYWKGTVTLAQDLVPSSPNLPVGIEVGDTIYGYLKIDPGVNPRLYEAKTYIEDYEWSLVGLELNNWEKPNQLKVDFDYTFGDYIDFPNGGLTKDVGFSVILAANTAPKASWTFGDLETFDPADYTPGIGRLYSAIPSGAGTELRKGYNVVYQIEQVSLQPIPVPEPGILSLAAALAGAFGWRRKRIGGGLKKS